MAKTLDYEGYKIASLPRHLADAGKWSILVLISFHHPDTVKSRRFSANSLYATEEEADIHGLAFVQRIIDGKADGYSVSDLKTADRRAGPRFRVQFRSNFSAPPKLEVTGVMLDLSSGGCRVESAASVMLGQVLELRIHAPDESWPIMVEEASVQWVSGQTFGLVFFGMKENAREGLGRVLMALRANHAC